MDALLALGLAGAVTGARLWLWYAWPPFWQATNDYNKQVGWPLPDPDCPRQPIIVSCC